MSSQTVIRVEKLSKKYSLQSKPGRGSGDGMRHALQKAILSPFHGIKSSLFRPNSISSTNVGVASPATSNGDFWALKDVSFELNRGEVLGVIGRNGAGKSTLLKVLSRITEPTGGRVGITGRVASLLEVGTGFHPELTGRENIFLNGAILGMARAEIKSKFDEIVAFSEVERFLDIPVKRYSSGMYIRLAFAVSAHLDAGILILDEVLAVGDSAFQEKCLGKMGSIASDGRAVLLVSHNMGIVSAWCKRGLFLEGGRVASDTTATEAIQLYLRQEKTSVHFVRAGVRPSTPAIMEAKLLSTPSEANVTIQVVIHSLEAHQLALDVRLLNEMGAPSGYGSLGGLDPHELLQIHAGCNIATVVIDGSMLANGTYSISLDLTVPFHAYLDRVEQCLSFKLARPPEGGRSRTLLQEWGHGSHELSLTKVKLCYT